MDQVGILAIGYNQDLCQPDRQYQCLHWQPIQWFRVLDQDTFRQELYLKLLQHQVHDDNCSKFWMPHSPWIWRLWCHKMHSLDLCTCRNSQEITWHPWCNRIRTWCLKFLMCSQWIPSWILRWLELVHSRWWDQGTPLLDRERSCTLPKCTKKLTPNNKHRNLNRQHQPLRICKVQSNEIIIIGNNFK